MNKDNQICMLWGLTGLVVGIVIGMVIMGA